MNEHSEKETASCAHEHSKSKSNTSIASWTYRIICTFWYWFGSLQKRTYFGYGRTYKVYWNGSTTSRGMGIWQVRVRAYDGYKYRHTIRCDDDTMCKEAIWVVSFLDMNRIRTFAHSHFVAFLQCPQRAWCSSFGTYLTDHVEGLLCSARTYCSCKIVAKHAATGNIWFSDTY